MSIKILALAYLLALFTEFAFIVCRSLAKGGNNMAAGLDHDIKAKDFIDEDLDTINQIWRYVRKEREKAEKNLAEAQSVEDKASEIWADGAIWAYKIVEQKIAAIQKINTGLGFNPYQE